MYQSVPANKPTAAVAEPSLRSAAERDWGLGAGEVTQEVAV